MTADQWISFGTLLVAVGGFSMVIISLIQKRRADNRAEWWKRYTWAIDRSGSADPITAEQAYTHLEVLASSKLATATEAHVIQMIVLDSLPPPSDNNDTEEDEVNRHDNR